MTPPMRTILTTAVVSIMLVLLPSSAGFTNGQPDGNAYPFVGMVAFTMTARTRIAARAR